MSKTLLQERYYMNMRNQKKGASKRKLFLASESFKLGYKIIEMMKTLLNDKEFELLIKKYLTLEINQKKMSVDYDYYTITKNGLKIKYLEKVLLNNSFDDILAEVIFLFYYENLLWKELIESRSINKELEAITNKEEFLKVKQHLENFLEKHCIIEAFLRS